MNNEIHTCDWFIEFFSAIPERRWCTGLFCGPDGDRCAVGHLIPDLIPDYKTDRAFAEKGQMPKAPPAARALFDLFIAIADVENDDDYETRWKVAQRLVYTINNDKNDPRYQQPTPKARILQALRDIKAKQEAEPPKPSPVPQPCVHLWLECGVCMFCSATKQVAPVAEQPFPSIPALGGTTNKQD